MSVGVLTAPDGRRATRRRAGAFELTRLEFPPSFRHGLVDPTRPYVALVLDGAVRKTFARTSMTLAEGTLATLPAGDSHSSAFAARGTTVLAVRSFDDAHAALLGRRRELRAGAARLLGRRIAGELERDDPCASLSLEGLVLQLLAVVGRSQETSRRQDGTVWLEQVREALHERTPAIPSLAELAEIAGRHPTHVARGFRLQFGRTIGDYARALRLEWAAARLDAGEPIARVAHDAGYADQSHFTRAFRASTGQTPGDYRARLERN